MPDEPERDSGQGALFIALGISASRVLGLVRERVFAHYLGNSNAAAALKAALRIPNFLQNLLGEGVLSASFIPVYAGLKDRDPEEADRVASAIFGLLSVAVSLLVLVGVAAAPILIAVIAPGFSGEDRDLTILLVRILFPGTGVLVLSAWCVGVLNSHRRFFVSYAAPILWNLAIIIALLGFSAGRDPAGLAELAAQAMVVGSVLQLLAQLPSVLALLGRFRPTLAAGRPSVRGVLFSFFPVLISRGVVQISSFVDTMLVSLLGARALSTLTYAQTLYLLPVSLFGISISAAELPAMAEASAQEEGRSEAIRARIETGLSRIAFWVIPSAVGLFCIGDTIGGALFQTGRFTSSDARYLWFVLQGASLGLLANTCGRLYSSAYFALKDTKTPFQLAVVRVSISAFLGIGLSMFAAEPLGLPREMGVVGLVLAGAAGSWIELWLLFRGLLPRIGSARLPRKKALGLFAAAVIAGLGALAAKVALTHWLGADPTFLPEAEVGSGFLPPPNLHPIPSAAAQIALFACLYFPSASWFGADEPRWFLDWLRSRFVRSRKGGGAAT